MPTFALPRFMETHASRLAHAKQLAAVVRETDADLNTIRQQHTAADSLTLRGIPAIGRGVAGVSPGTNPESIVHRTERRM
jgi:hypothetical protein